MNWLAILLFAMFVGVNLGKKLPPEFPKCKRDDPNLSECLKKVIEDVLVKLDNGIPSLKVPSLRPLQIPSITIGVGKGAVDFIQKFKNIKIFNIRNTKIQKLDVTAAPNDFKLAFETEIPEIRTEAEYSFNGRILLLPILGDGNCTVRLQNLSANFLLNAETIDKKDTKYLKVKEFTTKLDPENAVFSFDNLFNGDERLGTEMNRVINDNWKDVYDDIKEQYEAALGTILTDYTNKIFSQVPYNDLL